MLEWSLNRGGDLEVRESASLEGGHGFDFWPRQTIVFKTGSSGFPLLALRIMEISLRLVRQCQDNVLVKYWLKKVQEKWICELLPLNN